MITYGNLPGIGTHDYGFGTYTFRGFSLSKEAMLAMAIRSRVIPPPKGIPEKALKYLLPPITDYPSAGVYVPPGETLRVPLGQYKLTIKSDSKTVMKGVTLMDVVYATPEKTSFLVRFWKESTKTWHPATSLRYDPVNKVMEFDAEVFFQQGSGHWVLTASETGVSGTVKAMSQVMQVMGERIINPELPMLKPVEEVKPEKKKGMGMMGMGRKKKIEEPIQPITEPIVEPPVSEGKPILAGMPTLGWVLIAGMALMFIGKGRKEK